MRSDMAKVIVERPRRGGGVPFPLRANPDDDRLTHEEWRSRQGIRRPWHGNGGKDLNENLAPLRRYLQSQVGRPWNKVYSEICQRINRKSAVQLHIWQHLMQYVCTDPYVINGDVDRRWRWFEFIVDPRTGLLRQNQRRWKPPARLKPANPDRVRVSDRIQYHRLNGIWYEVELAVIPQGHVGFDMVFKSTLKLIEGGELRRMYGAPVYAARKRQLNTKEIRNAGLARPRAV